MFESFQLSRCYIFPWISWSIIYFLIALSCAIYELSLGGRIFEVTAVPAFYSILFILWFYSIWCVIDFYRSLKVQFDDKELEFHSEEDLVRNLHVARLKSSSMRRDYPRPIWDSPLITKVKHNTSFRNQEDIFVTRV